MRPKVLVTDYVHSNLIQGLEERGYHVDYNRNILLDELPNSIGDYEGIIINSKIKMFKPLLDLGKRLKFIGRLGSGLEIIDLDYAASKGIKVINTPNGNNNAVAEHVMGMLLALSNNLLRADAEVRDFNWNREKNRGWELRGKTIGIIGFGHTGSQVAKKLKNWDVDVIGYDKYYTDWDPFYDYVEQVNQEDILKRADVITLHLPLTNETQQLVNETFLNSCKTGAVIINTSRGKIVDTKALVDALKHKKISGACLDVFENEKPSTYTSEEKNTYNNLFQMSNVVVSPHIAGWTHESLLRIAEILLHKIDAI